jgi:hypothetical protein
MMPSTNNYDWIQIAPLPLPGACTSRVHTACSYKDAYKSNANMIAASVPPYSDRVEKPATLPAWLVCLAAAAACVVDVAVVALVDIVVVCTAPELVADVAVALLLGAEFATVPDPVLVGEVELAPDALTAPLPLTRTCTNSACAFSASNVDSSCTNGGLDPPLMELPKFASM